MTRLLAFSLRRLLLLLVWRLLLSSSMGSAASEVTLGLFIGNNQPFAAESASRVLSFADDDVIDGALSFHTLFPQSPIWLLIAPDLETSARWQVQRERAFPTALEGSRAGRLTQHLPTRAELEQTLSELAREIRQRKANGAHVTLLFHFAGHGDLDGSLHLQDQRLPAPTLLERLLATGADQVLALLDACYLGRFVGGSEPPSRAPSTPAPAGKPSLATARGRSLFLQESLAQLRPTRIFSIASLTPVPEDPSIERGLLSLLGWTCLAGLADAREPQISFAEWGDCIRSQLDADRLRIQLRIEPADARAELPVVSLADAPGGFALAPGFFEGRVRVLRSSGREVIGEFVHDGKSRVRLQLAPDTYELRRLVKKEGWNRSDLPAERMTLKVEGAPITLPSPNISVQPVVLASRGADEPPPPGYEVEKLSQEEEHSVRHSPLRAELPRTLRQVQPSWSLRVDGLQPLMGSDLGPVEQAEGLELGRLWPMARWRRWSVQGGPVLGMALFRYSDVPLNASESVQEVSRAEWALGPTFQLHRSGALLRAGVELGWRWVPSTLLVPPSNGSQTSSALEQVGPFPGNTVLAAGASVRIPILPGWEIGPTLTLEALDWRDGDPQAMSQRQLRLRLGLVLRQDALRRGGKPRETMKGRAIL